MNKSFPLGPGTSVYLSPHSDDIAFSLGALLARRPGGVLLTLFTRSAHVAGAAAGPGLPGAEAIERVSALRRAEDQAFARRVGLEWRALGLAEPALLGRNPFDINGLREDIEQLREPLAAALQGLPGPLRLFCPAGIGGHVNHVATRDAVIGLMTELSPQTRLAFYEDLPYAARRQQRRAGLRALRQAAGAPLRRQAWHAGAEKLELLNLYPSQHRRAPTSLRRFSPAALWPPGPHEAIWTLQR